MHGWPSRMMETGRFSLNDASFELHSGNVAGAERFVAELDRWAGGDRSSKWPTVACALAHGVRCAAYERWLDGYQQRFLANGGTRRAWPAEGLPAYDRDAVRKRLDAIDRSGRSPEDADPLSLVEADPEEVGPASRFLGELPEDVARETAVRAPMFWTWTWADALFADSPALEAWARTEGWVRDRGSASAADLLALFDFEALKAIAGRCGIVPPRSIARTRALLAHCPEVTRDLLLRALDDRSGQRELVRVELPGAISARTLLLARAYARGLACYLRELVEGREADC